MKNCVQRCAAVSVAVLVLASTGTVNALQVPQKEGRFDGLVVEDPVSSLDVATTPVGSLVAADAVRGGWEQFKTAHGPAWSIYVDRRSGAPLLAEGNGIPWPAARNATVDSLARSLREFAAANQSLLLADDAELVLDEDGSGELVDGVWQIAFDHVVAGVPVSGDRYLFTIGHGRLISFGSPRWSRIDASPFPDIDSPQAQELVLAYMKLTAVDAPDFFEKTRLQFIPLRKGDGSTAAQGPYAGTMGDGYTSALVWRVAVRVAGSEGTWVAQVDAHTGAIRSFRDENMYARAKGGVYPISNDQQCPDGCEQANYPLPFTNIVGSANQTTTSMGLFNCTPGGTTATTNLNGQYFRISDGCGQTAQTVTCDADLNMGVSGGTDCTVPAGSSNGNTHAARSSFYHLNRIAEHARAWLPANNWVKSQVATNVNINDVCNAFWDGAGINFFKSGGGCRNTGEIAGVFLHEWGHGLDQNDGGGFDNPSEAYADITSLLATHVSCMGRGFIQSGNCGGYGNGCLSCSGIRELDWDKRVDHVPSTPGGFTAAHCPGGGGPCGREVHCEGYVGGETLWDLATRDLTAAGLDLPSAWQIADKLWYKSRLGSGGNAWSCSLPASDGCAATSWFSKLRAVDDDDGNLANGTPHAAAIFAAFDRHGIACGTAASPSNQSTTTCPPLGASTLNAQIGNGITSLNWTPVANAASYRVLRNEFGCAAGSTIVATTAATTFTDTGLANGFTEYYTIQAVGSNAACDGLVSNCQTATPQPFAGFVNLGAASYSCTGAIGVTVIDGNIGGATTSVHLSSTTDPAGETITLNQIAPGSDTYTGTISLTTNPPAADGLISAVNGDMIVAQYVDASDGGGGTNIPRQTSALADCIAPAISKVQATNVTGTDAKITWTTNESSSSAVHYGTAPPPPTTKSVAAPVVAHAVDVSGLTECTPYVYSVDSTDTVGNLATDNAFGSYYGFATGKGTQTSYVSADTPIAIPDNSPVGATSTITVADARTVQDVNVIINVQHTFDGDLTFDLTTPTGLTIRLANPHGSGGDNYTNTVLDDEAPIPITLPAPFTGTFRPDTPLNVADGLNSLGAWQFKAIDRSGQDTGSILNWTLQLTYSAPSCAPHGNTRSKATVADACVTGGPGNADGNWDAGEHVQFKLTLGNDGGAVLTGVTATVTSTTPGVVIEDGTSSFPDIPVGGAADSIAPHFRAYLPTSLACGGTISFNVAISTNQGPFAGSFAQAVGHATNGTGRVLDESFGGGIPATWTVLDGGSGGGAAATWTTANPGVRTIAAPMLVPVATLDSDAAGPTATQEESLLTPVLDMSTAATATLQFDEFFRWFAGGGDEVGDVDVRSSLTGGAWVNVLHHQGGSSGNPAHQTVDISAQAAGAADAQVRFREFGAANDQYWQLDNVTIDTAAPGSCAMPVCSPPVPGGAKPVADGVTGLPMKGSRGNAVGSVINLTWDVTTCASADHHVLYGDLATVASAAVSGAACDLGTSGSADWTSVPVGNLWFVVVGDDDGTVEGTWGTDGAGGQRGGTTASGLCGVLTRDNATVCP